MLTRLTSLLGLAVMIGIAYALSEKRRRIDWRLVSAGLALQFAVARLVLKTRIGGNAAGFMTATIAGVLL